MIEFYKMNGTGNDFIIIDNRNNKLGNINLNKFAKNICRRKYSVGADGLIIVEKSNIADFRWLFFNSNGTKADMCGNGGRCVAKFAFFKKIAGKKMAFETNIGIIKAEIINELVKLSFIKIDDLKLNQSIEINKKYFFINTINTGVPHAVIFINNIDSFDVYKYGKYIRFHKLYEPIGTNVNFVELYSKNTIKLRTYERGVENETFSCGTGAVASALISASINLTKSPVNVLFKNGDKLKVFFEKSIKNDNSCIFFYNVFLEGKALLIYKAKLYEKYF